MSISRGDLRASVLDYAEAAGSQRWDSTAGGLVDRRISAVFDSIWGAILDANRFYRCSKRTPTSDANGRYAISDLSSGSETDAAERFRRILTVIIDGVHYEGPVDLPGYALADLGGTANPGGNPCVWYQEGSNIAAVPFQASKTADAIWVNWRPQSPIGLEGEDSVLDFPDGYEEVLILRSAARLLMKGGAETQASLELKGEAQEDYDRMLEEVTRISTNPLQMRHADNPADWGG